MEDVGIDIWWKKNQNFSSQLRVTHFFYEFGCFIYNLKVSHDTPLAIEIAYSQKEMIPQGFFKLKKKFPKFTLAEPFKFADYLKGFNKIKQHLLDGNCYQVNFTFTSFYKSKNKITLEDFFNQLWSQKELIGAYAHATILPEPWMSYISNSPECLVQKKMAKLQSMPIKGTVKFNNSKKDFNQKSQELLHSQKEEAELFMIVDLLKNDLSKVEGQISYVKKPFKKILKVNSLIHQYSLIEVPITKKLQKTKVIEALFPGGSITGAPKKRVMQIIQDVEKKPRGFYCGSTLLELNGSWSASINIRSAEINLQNASWSYGAGGGITLLSEAQKEYEELNHKRESFMSLLLRN